MDLATRYEGLSKLKGVKSFKVSGGNEWAFYANGMGLVMCWPGFPTHFVSKRDSKGSPAQYDKPSGNGVIYGRLNRFQRHELNLSMGQYFMPLCQEVRRFVTLSDKTSYQILLEVGVPKNWDRVARSKKTGKVSWKPPAPDYKPTWDLDNWFFVHKNIQDALVKWSIIRDDTIDQFPQCNRSYKEVADLNDRYLLLAIKPI